MVALSTRAELQLMQLFARAVTLDEGGEGRRILPVLPPKPVHGPKIEQVGPFQIWPRKKTANANRMPLRPEPETNRHDSRGIVFAAYRRHYSPDSRTSPSEFGAFIRTPRINLRRSDEST